MITMIKRLLFCRTLDRDDVMLCFSSLYWLSGFGTLISTTIRGATRIITTESFSPELFLYIVEKYKVTVALSAPSYVAVLLQSDRLNQSSLSSIKKYLCGGSFVAKELCEELNKYLINGSIQVGYGMTEISGLLSLNDSRKHYKSVGKLAANSKVKLIDDNGIRVGVNETGEICCKPLYPFLGYYGSEESTTQILDAEGWIHTGDMGYFDDDGFLYIVDRKKDILKCMNYQISPSEIESIILSCDGVSNVCVVGVPDLIRTELPAAVIVRANVGSKVMSDVIEDLVKQNCSDFKQLRGGVYFVDSLPMTPSGKILRRKVRDLAIELYHQKAGIVH